MSENLDPTGSKITKSQAETPENSDQLSSNHTTKKVTSKAEQPLKAQIDRKTSEFDKSGEGERDGLQSYLSPILKSRPELFINLAFEPAGEEFLKTEISEAVVDDRFLPISKKVSNRTNVASSKQPKLGGSSKLIKRKSSSNRNNIGINSRATSDLSYSMKNGDDSFDSASAANSYFFGMQDYYHQNHQHYIPNKSTFRKRGTSLHKQKSNAESVRTKVKRSYYQMLGRKLARRNSRELDEPEEFEELIYEIDEEIRTPNIEKNRDLKLVKMPQLEQAQKYHDTYPCLEFRKSIMIAKARIVMLASKIIKHPVFDAIILFVIVANSITLAFSDAITNKSPLPPGFDTAYLAIYTTEMFLKIVGMGFIFNEGAYLREAWNVMDFAIVITAYIPYLITNSTLDLRAFRALRVLRPLRTISSIEQLRILIITLIASLKSLLNILFLLLFLFSIFAIAGLQLFQGVLKRRCFDIDTGIVLSDPSEDSNDGQKYCASDSDCGVVNGILYICGKMIANPEYGIINFDTVFDSLLMVFQVVTMEGWSNIMVVLQKTFSPYVVFYFIFLIFIGTFFLLNLTLAVIKTEFSASAVNVKSGKSKEISDESWNNKNLAAKISQHKLDILDIRRKQTMGKFLYHKYQFKRNNMIAIPSSKYSVELKPKIERKQTRWPWQRVISAIVIKTKQLKERAARKQQKNNSPELNSSISNSFHHNTSKAHFLNNLSVIEEPNDRNWTLGEGNEVDNNDFQKFKAELGNKINQKNSPEAAAKSSNIQTFRNTTEDTKTIFVKKEEEEEDSPRRIIKMIAINKKARPAPALIELVKPVPLQNEPFGALMATIDEKQQPPDFEVLLTEGMEKMFQEKQTIEQQSHNMIPKSEPEILGTSMIEKINKIKKMTDAPKQNQWMLDDSIRDSMFLDDIDQQHNEGQQFARTGRRQRTFKSLPRSSFSKESSAKQQFKRQKTKKKIIDIGGFDNEQEETVIIPEKKIAREPEEEVLVLDLRRVKVVPVQEREYEETSLVDVLPSKKETEEQRLMEKENQKIRETKMRLSFPITNFDKRREEHVKSLAKKNKGEGFLEPLEEVLSRVNQEVPAEISQVTPMPMNEEETTTVTSPQENQEQQPENEERKPGYLAIKRSKASLQIIAQQRKEEENNSSPKDLEFHNLQVASGSSPTKKSFGNNKALLVPISSSAVAAAAAVVEEEVEEKPIDLTNFREVKKKINEKFSNENDNDEAAVVEGQEVEFPKEFRNIRLNDILTDEITKNNWSGDNVLLFSNLNFPIIKAKLGLSFKDPDIWRPGVLGVVHAIRRKTGAFINSSFFNNLIILSVLLNTLVLASDGLVKNQTALNAMSTMNLIFTIIFTIEMVLKLFVLGLIDYVRDKINIMDAAIVILSLVEAIFLGGSSTGVKAFRTVRLFRTFRVIRVTKLLRSLAYMQVIIGVTVRALKKFMYIAIFLFLLLFIYTLLGMQIFGGNLDVANNTGSDRLRQNFNSFINSFMTVFQVMTQENWSDVLSLMLRSSISPLFSLIYLVSWIFIGNYIFLNLFLAILLDEFTSEEVEEELQEIQDEFGDDPYSLSNITSSNTPQTTASKSQTPRAREAQTPKTNPETPHHRGKEPATWSQAVKNEKKARKKASKPAMFEGIKCQKSLYIFSKRNFFRRGCYKIVKHKHFETVIFTAIILSSIKLALDTFIPSDNEKLLSITKAVDVAFNIFFACESALKIISFGFILDRNSYLRDTWSVLDFCIAVASMLDVIIQELNLKFLKVLRLLRTLRPLRFISHNISMKLVVTALLESVGGIANVFIVVLIIWMMFGILAMNIVGGKLGYCDNLPDTFQSYYQIGESKCAKYGGTWTNPSANFDNIFNSLLTLFILSTQEDWPDITFSLVDANDAEQGPIENGNKAFGFAFSIVFLFVGAYFLINLFIGVIFLNYAQAQKRENVLQKFLTVPQQKWVTMQKLILNSKPDLSNVPPERTWIKPFFKLINSTYFDVFILTAIILNIITMGLSYDDSSQGYTTALKYVNWGFSAIFLIEMILKHLGLGFKRYWFSGWNQFDAFVVFASLIDIVFDILEQSVISFLRVGPQLARVLRVLRVSRLFKLVKKFENLQKIINVLIFSLPALFNVGALLCLVYFIYAILGTFLFQNVVLGTIIDDHFNFSNFAFSLITLFRSSTGEDWWYIMFDCIHPVKCADGTNSCGTPAGYAFWLSFVLICQFIFLNLFILVILQQFEEYHLNPDNPVTHFRDKLDIFRVTWDQFSLKFGATKIPAKQLVPFFMNLPAPLGYKGAMLTKKTVAKEITMMSLIADKSGMVYYNDVLFAALKNSYGVDADEEEIQLYLEREEINTRIKLEQLKKKLYQKGSIAVGMKTARIEENTQAENPIFRMLFMGMTLKLWAKYAHKKTEAMKAAAENEMEYFSSENNSDQDEDEDEYQINYLNSKEGSEDEAGNENENDEIIEEESPEDEQSPIKLRAHTPIGFENIPEKSLFGDISFVQSESKTPILEEQRGEVKNFLEPMKINVKRVENESQAFLSVSRSKSQNRSRSFSVDEGEEMKSQNIINYNINNNFVINNNYYFNENGGGSPKDVATVVQRVNVELHQDVQINRITLKSPKS